MNRRSLDLGSIRERLRQTGGKEYWRCLEELADTDEFKEFLQQEFPRHASAWMESLDRRSFLKVMGASLALAGLSGCLSPAPAPPDEKIVPYVTQPEEIIPGKPLYFATAMPFAGFGRGVIAESHMGRPTKIEGNANHPASLGSTDVFMQASVLDLYDPDRSEAVSQAGLISDWTSFVSALQGQVAIQRRAQGEGLRILTETVTSPTLASQLHDLLTQFPKARWCQYDPVGRDLVYEGSRLAFGEVVETLYRFDRADTILSIDSDFLFFGPAMVRYARDFSDKRRVHGPKDKMNRLYAVERTPTVTGSMADHRLPLGPTAIGAFTKIVAGELGIDQGSAPAEFPADYKKWVQALVRDLKAHRGSSIIIAGDQQPAEVHRLAHAMNHMLGNVGKTVIYTDPISVIPKNQGASFRDLVRDMEKNAAQVLIILGGNPVYTAPANINFGKLLLNSPFTVHLSSHENETSTLCRWHVPEAHYLESWSDVRAFDGTISIIQPLIAPLYGGKTAHELVSALLGKPDRGSYDIVRSFWAEHSRGQDFETFWRKSVHDGIVSGTGAEPKQVTLKSPQQTKGEPEAKPQESSAGGSKEGALEILFRPDPTIFDGRFANNGWLQETPKPLTKLTWDNTVMVSPSTAERLDLHREVGNRGGEHGTIFADEVELEFQGRKVRGAVWIMPGQADDCVTVHLGYGRSRAGRVGNGAGFNAYALRTTETFWHGSGAKIRKTGVQQPLACTQFHHLMEGRELLRSATIDEYRKNPNFVSDLEEETPPHPSLYPGFTYKGHSWGMTIDINSCIGCNACVVACVAENNGPVVGKLEVLRGREMHWIRIDRYYKGTLDNPQMFHQPVPCMQCENAPCEMVCPVHATTHSDDGLNDMTYNRCVGTRYCSNNCPYKVRRFNFFLYGDFETPSLKLLRNPDVTVRSRGVMEKCTYCVQRIRETEINAKVEDRPIRDGEIMTACQQACPTQAIMFGDMNDPNTHVSKLKAESLDYTLLDGLNTKPHTSYHAKLRNPNPEIEEA